MNYNFSSSNANAYGDNQIQVDASPVIYAVYNGDANQDGTVDLNDVLQIFNAANAFAGGYVATDINGDDIVDLNDVLIAYNNATTFVAAVKP